MPVNRVTAHPYTREGEIPWDHIATEPNTGCWLWIGALRPKGYGMIRRRRATRAAHVEVYELVKGSVPVGLELDHLCRVRSCVNPDHLQPVSHQENCQRGDLGKWHLKIGTCPQGHPYDAVDRVNGVVRGRRCQRCDTERHRRRRHAG